MEENGVDRGSVEGTDDYLIVKSNNAEELESGSQVFQHLTCLESKNVSFEQNVSHGVLSTIDDASPSPNAEIQLCQPPPFPVEDFQLVDQNCHSLYEVQSLEGSRTHMMIVASHSENGQVLHVVPSSQSGIAQVIIPQGQLLDISSSGDVSQETNCDGDLQTVAVAAIADNTSSYIFHPEASLTVSKKTAAKVLEHPFPVSPQPLPPNTPAWARRLRSCEKIGDSYRGYCSSEMELDSVLIMHKQQTQSVWGTRQSPSPAKPATRLMWKSQYVPYDGIPFVNAGSRAIVMECQYGPRRKGFQPRKSSEQENISCRLYKATCPARIYIKKVQKFPEYRVPTDPKIDKKIIRMEQEKAFNMLKKNLIEVGGVLRWYVQLPTQQAHQYHEMEEMCLPPSPYSMSSPEEDDDTVREENGILPSRLHPQVADKIRELVSQGIQQVYAVRKQLRKFVEQELFKPDEVPERHNLSFFPTVNDIKNHIHEVQKTLKNGKVVYNSETIPAMLQWTTDGGNILTETVTVTFASPPTEGFRIDSSLFLCQTHNAETYESVLPTVNGLPLEFKLSCPVRTWIVQANPVSQDVGNHAESALASICMGDLHRGHDAEVGNGSSPEKTIIKLESNQTRELLGSEMTQLLSSLQPRVLAQLKGLQLQPALTSTDGMATLITVGSYSPPSSSSLLQPTGRPLTSKSIIGHGHAVQDSSCQTLNSTTVSQLEEQPLPDQRDCFVTAGSTEDAKTVQEEAHQILSGDEHIIPTHTVDSHLVLSKNPESAVSTDHVDHRPQPSEVEEFRDFQASSVT